MQPPPDAVGRTAAARHFFMRGPGNRRDHTNPVVSHGNTQNAPARNRPGHWRRLFEKTKQRRKHSRRRESGNLVRRLMAENVWRTQYPKWQREKRTSKKSVLYISLLPKRQDACGGIPHVKTAPGQCARRFAHPADRLPVPIKDGIGPTSTKSQKNHAAPGAMRWLARNTSATSLMAM